ncbi:MAG: sulfite exporter TauE/SafE family protein [Nitrospinae bacterium]|nr:sulfite exporter TauE/SafE family protein [Nitrospinota bacterium]
MLESLIGFTIAFAIAMTGVGAGTVTAPVLILFLGMEPPIAVGTALGFSSIVKIPAGISYLTRKRVDFKYLGLMCAGGVPGVILGNILLSTLSANHAVKTVVLVAVGAIVLLSAVMNMTLMASGGGVSRHAEKFDYIIPVATFFIGLEVGFSSAGAGALGTMLLLYATKLFACTVVGTDILFGLVVSVVGGGINIGMGTLDYGMMAKLVSGGIFGSLLGSYTATKVPAKPFRVVLLVWLLFIGSQLLYRGITG